MKTIQTTMKCKNCGSTNNSVIRDTLRYDIKRDVLSCNECSLVFLDAPKEETEDFYESKTYRKKYGPDLTREFNPQEVFDTYLPAQEKIIKEIEHILHPKMNVLDVGCSTGHFLTALKDRVGTRVGFELSKNETDFIRKSLDFKVYDTPIETTEVSEGPFDLITCLQVLEHIDEPRPFLEAVVRNLKPEGYLFIEVPNINDILVGTYKNEEYMKFFFHEPHISYFSATTLLDLLGRVGVKGDLKTVQHYTVMNHINWLLTSKPQKNFIIGNATPQLISDTSVPKEISNDFNTFIQDVDVNYKKLVNKHGLGESLSFLGRKH